MSILVGRNTKLITIGFTGKHGTYHSLQSRDYGTTLVGGVSPGIGNSVHEGYPVFNTVYEAVQKTDANAAMVLLTIAALAFAPVALAQDSSVDTQALKDQARENHETRQGLRQERRGMRAERHENRAAHREEVRGNVETRRGIRAERRANRPAGAQ